MPTGEDDRRRDTAAIQGKARSGLDPDAPEAVMVAAVVDPDGPLACTGTS